MAWLDKDMKGFEIGVDDLRKELNSKLRNDWNFTASLVIHVQDQDHIWWKILNFSSELFLENGH